MRRTIAEQVAGVVVTATVLVAAGCGDKAAKSSLVFTPDDPGSGASVFLQVQSQTDTHLTLEVVGQNIQTLYGVAFRLQYDGEALRLVSVTPSDVWPADALARAAEPANGLTVAAVTARGRSPGFDADATVLATVVFEIRARRPSPVVFVGGRSAVVLADGSTLEPIVFAGGQLELR